MDFEMLANILPKPSVMWTVSDIQIWLKFIDLSAFSPMFRAASVDGSCLSDLTEDDVRMELKIESKIITKKLMIWIKQGLQKYDAFLLEYEKQQSSSMIKTLAPRYIEKHQLLQQKAIEKNQQFQAVKLKEKRQTAQHQSENKQINELIIKQCQSSIYNCYSLKQHNGTIGRNSKNQIHVLDENVSRHHAQIEFQEGKYYIRDLGSSSGTFLRITEKTPLKHEHILEMGSNQFYVDLTNNKNIVLQIIEGPNVDTIYNVTSSQGKASVGRKTTNEISLPDQHLSNIHSTIFSVEGVWYIEDMVTTNGTWIRLSPEGIKSERIELKNQTQFKLGSSLTFQCQMSNDHRKTQKLKSDKCQQCKLSQKDCIFIPCKHNVMCYKCTQLNQLVHCVSCGSAITEIMKIFKV